MQIEPRSNTQTRPKVGVLIPKVMRAKIFPKVVEDSLSAFAQPVFASDDTIASGELDALLDGVTGVITGWRSPRIPSHLLAPKGSIAFVSHAAGSVKPLGVQDALEAGHVRVSHAAPVIAQAVAEFTLTQILAHLRHHRDLDAGLRIATPWFDLRDASMGELLGAKDVGIVGLGYVGRLVLNLLQPFGCNVCVYDPFIDAEQARDLGVTLVSLPEMFKRCTVVSLHAANLPVTEGMITRQHLEALRPGGLLVNTARAGLVEKGALSEVLKQGRIFAALDTYEIEPLPEGDALRRMHNVYLSPHSAGHTSDSYVLQGLSAVEDMRRFFAGEIPKQEILREKAAVLA